MKYFVSAVVASVVVGVFAQNISIPTPSNVVQCTNISITWQGGSPPYTLLFQNANANGAILQTVSNIPSNTFVWNTDIQGPTQIGMTVRDTNGLTGQSGPFDINTNTDTSCLNAASSASVSVTDSATVTDSSAVTTGSSAVTSGSSAPAGSTTSGPSSSAPTSGSTSASGSGPASSNSASGTSSGPAASQTSASSAANVAVSGFTGLFGVLLAAFLA